MRVRLIRIHTTREVAEIDRHLRAKINRLERNRRQIAQLAAGDQPPCPTAWSGYLDRLRGLGINGGTSSWSATAGS